MPHIHDAVTAGDRGLPKTRREEDASPSTTYLELEQPEVYALAWALTHHLRLDTPSGEIRERLIALRAFLVDTLPPCHREVLARRRV